MERVLPFISSRDRRLIRQAPYVDNHGTIGAMGFAVFLLVI